MGKTMQEQFASGLEALGERRVKTTFRYIVYSRKQGGFYYLGRAGAFRVGRNIKFSVPVLQHSRDYVMAKAVEPAPIPVAPKGEFSL